MNPVSCQCDSVTKGNISITESASFSSSIDFITSSNDNDNVSSSWTCEIQNVVQLQVGKKAPFTAARISYKKDNESICKTLIFSSAEDRSAFVSVVERIKKEQDETREKQKQVKLLASSNVKQEDASQHQKNNNNDNDDDDDEVNIISIRRKAWLDNDNMSSQVFQLLSDVSAFGSSNRISRHKKKSELSKKNKENDSSSGSSNDDDDNFDLSSSSASADLFDSILREEEQKYFIHPDRQEMASASVYDALNSLVDPATNTLRPVSQAVAAGVFKQIPHLAAVYSRVVHSAEDEMLFWVSVVRRRLFFSRTKLDSELAECGNVLCPLTTTTTTSRKDSSMTNKKIDNNDREGGNDDEEDRFLIEELDLQEQRPKHDQVREIQKASSSSTTRNNHNNNNVDKKNSVAALVSELNFASGKCVDDLSALIFERKTNRNSNDDDKARLLQFGAMGFAEKQEAEKILQQEKTNNEQQNVHDDSRRRQRNDEDATRTNQKKVDYSLAIALAKNLSTLQEETKITSTSDDNWRVVFVGKTPFQALREVEEHNNQLLRQVANNNNSVLQSQNKNSSSADVKPVHHHSNEYSSSLLRQVGSSSSSVHGRAAAFLVKIFWRKAKETFDLTAKKNHQQESSTMVKKFQKKVDAAVSRLRGIRQSLQNVLEQWNVGEDEHSSNTDLHILDKKEKRQWTDSLKQIENVISLLQ